MQKRHYYLKVLELFAGMLPARGDYSYYKYLVIRGLQNIKKVRIVEFENPGFLTFVGFHSVSLVYHTLYHICIIFYSSCSKQMVTLLFLQLYYSLFFRWGITLEDEVWGILFVQCRHCNITIWDLYRDRNIDTLCFITLQHYVSYPCLLYTSRCV